jgi:hypothetical protein
MPTPPGLRWQWVRAFLSLRSVRREKAATKAVGRSKAISMSQRKSVTARAADMVV